MGEYRLVDLSHPIHHGMTTYPGLPEPVLSTHMSRDESRSHYAAGTEFHIGKIELVANTGTYVDAPYHRYADADDIASLPLSRLVDVPATIVKAKETAIGPDIFSAVDLSGVAVLIHTGWDSRFGTEEYLGGHPYLTPGAAQLLVDRRAAIVGIDSANIDSTSGGERPAHSLLLQAGIPVVEHMTNLGSLGQAEEIYFTALPAPIQGIGTFPVRAVARIRSQ